MASKGGTTDRKFQKSNEIWEGENKIVIGIDIGTTQSGVAFTYLVNGGKQQIHRISQWPGQMANNQTTKIPTVVWYDNKQAVSFGAEALSRDVTSDADENGWALAQNFKLHLHPPHMRADNIKPDPLPNGVSLLQIYSDFMGYLFTQTKSYFEDHIINGKKIWARYMPNMEVIITHPNGWYTREQAFLRSAAIRCGVLDMPGAALAKNIRFVTEAEASVHYCIQHANLSSQLNVGAKFAVCDAGGSTVDTTLYSITSTQPVLQLKEVRASASIQAGGIFVNEAFEARLRGWMEELGLEHDEVDDYSKAGTEDFEFAAKRSFGLQVHDLDRKFTIKVAGDKVREGDPSNVCRIHRGCMKVPSSELKECFDACVKPIISSVDGLLKGLDVGHILLVGGFGDSPYLRRALKDKYEDEEQNIQVTLANDSTSKAVADGAVIWSTILCTSTDDLQGREVYPGPGGIPSVAGSWAPVVRKGITVAADEIYRRNHIFTYEAEHLGLVSLSSELYAYTGDDEPDWGWDENDNLLPEFIKVGTIEAQILDTDGAMEYQKGSYGGSGYWTLSLDVCIRFGSTALETWVEWKQNGVIRTGPASIVTEDPTTT